MQGKIGQLCSKGKVIGNAQVMLLCLSSDCIKLIRFPREEKMVSFKLLYFSKRYWNEVIFSSTCGISHMKLLF